MSNDIPQTEAKASASHEDAITKGLNQAFIEAMVVHQTSLVQIEVTRIVDSIINQIEDLTKTTMEQVKSKVQKILDNVDKET